MTREPKLVQAASSTSESFSGNLWDSIISRLTWGPTNTAALIFVKALPREGDGFTYFCRKFHGVKIREGLFVGSDIRKLMNDENFESCLGEAERDKVPRKMER